MSAATIFFDTSDESQRRVMDLMAKLFIFGSFAAFNILTIIEICLQIDLVLTLQKPFARTQNRQRVGIGVALVIGILAGAAQIWTDNDLLAPIN